MKRLYVSAMMLIAGGLLTLSAQKITISAQNRPADIIFKEIARQAGKNFVYSADLLKGMNVSVNARGQELTTVLDRMFAGTNVQYKIRGKNIVLSRAATKKSQTVTLSGFVREAGSGEPLVGATVGLKSGAAATFTNTMGFYSLTIPAGNQEIRTAYPGYDPMEIRVDANRNISRNINLLPSTEATTLGELEVIASPNRDLAMESASIGTMNVSKAKILNTPVIFGESDVIKTLQLEPGVSAGIEGMAGMYVHGGNTDENMYMLDNIPLYQVNHFGGLFSAFNIEALRNVDFYKSSFPAKYDGRLSSFMDVNTKDGSMESHHGSVKLGLTSGAFNIDGPIIKNKTSYSFAIRRSWYDVLTIPAFAIINASSKSDKTNVGYAFMDINAKITHRFSDRSKGYVMFYYGDDYLKVKQEWDVKRPSGDYDINNNNLRWGNIVASAGWNYVFTPKLFGEFSGAFTRYYSRLLSEYEEGEREDGKVVSSTTDRTITHNNINDWIFKADFDWHLHPLHRINFGAGYTYHSFLPARTSRTLTTADFTTSITDRVTSYHANEFNAYFGGDWHPVGPLRVNYGAHLSMFNIEGKTHTYLSPRLSARWAVNPEWVIKGGYSRTVQYVHQLMQSSISLPTDQWIPIVGDQKPQTSDKIAAGVYYSPNKDYVFSIEGFWKWMDNLLEYADEYYLLPPEEEWSSKLTPGKGTSKGIDFKVAKEFGKLTGHVAYSLMWADRQYADKNHGKKFPARFDNRHKINIVVNWKINSKWEASAAWTGMSGNRITLPTQCWEDPALAPWHYDMLLDTDVNNFRLPFYHRLDLSFKRNTKKGYWTFSLYNAYCNMNTIGVRRDYSDDYIIDENGNIKGIPTYQKIKLIPIIPSVSYTWLF